MDDMYVFLGVVLLVTYLVATGILIADYIISSLAMFRIARKRGVSKPWIAWIPVVNVWTFGSIVDGFEAEKGSKRKFRTILLVLGIILMVSIAVAVSVGVYFITDSYYYGYGIMENVTAVAFIYAAYFLVSFIAIVYWALTLICLHKIYENIYPEKSIKYLVISLLVPLGYSICLLKNSKRCEEKIFEDNEKEVGED